MNRVPIIVPLLLAVLVGSDASAQREVGGPEGIIEVLRCNGLDEAWDRSDFETVHESAEICCDRAERIGCYYLGLLNEQGLAVEQDPEVALEIHAENCEGGYAESCTRAGVMLGDGLGTAQDLAAAAARFESACELGSSAGCVGLGLLMEQGRGVQRDTSGAAEHFRDACSDGYDPGCVALEALETRRSSARSWRLAAVVIALLVLSLGGFVVGRRRQPSGAGPQ